MKKIINDPSTVVDEALQGMALAHPDLLRIQRDPAVIARADAPVQGKVALVSGGGSGHEPMHGGFVGAGFAARSGALIDKLGPDHARKLYAQSQRGVAIVRTAIDELGRPDIRMGSGKLTVSRTDQGTGFADRTRALAAKLGASFEPGTQSACAP